MAGWKRCALKGEKREGGKEEKRKGKRRKKWGSKSFFFFFFFFFYKSVRIFFHIVGLEPEAIIYQICQNRFMLPTCPYKSFTYCDKIS